MNHIDHFDKHNGVEPAHHAKAGDWLHHGKPTHHKPGFYESHSAGTFHSLGDSAISLPR